MVNLDESPFLTVGTEVSAKFKGAFCKAKIKKISKSVKCKVQYSNRISAFITDDTVKGQLKFWFSAIFDDGDITCLKRTALCLKSRGYFADSATLDQLPQTHPEHNDVTPIRTTLIQSRRSQTQKKSMGESVEEETLAMEKKDRLPPQGDRDSSFSVHKKCIASDCEPIDSDNSDKESIEQKDHLVALLFKFMDDRGTPINQAPVINKKDVDLYTLFKVVNNCGGYNKVNKGELWKFVAYKVGHEKQSYNSIKHSYQQYLLHFEDFYRKLGCTMLSHLRRERSHNLQSNRFSRSIVRNVNKTLPNTSSTTDEIKFAKNELNDKKNENSVVIKKTAIKVEEKLIKYNEETSKKGDKKKENIANRTSYNKLLVKWDPEITKTKDPVRNSKTIKEMKKILKKEIDSDAVDDDHIIEDKKLEKKIYTRNLFRKSMRKITKKEKIVKEKSTNTGLPFMRKIRASKEQVKTLVKEITPFKNSNRVPCIQQNASNNGKHDETSKLTRSKTKEDLPIKSRRESILSNLGKSVSVVQLTQPGLLVDNLTKIKKENKSEKMTTGRKKKGDKNEKVFSNDIILTPAKIENVPFDKDTPVVVGDNLVVYNGDKEATTHDAKVINVCEGAMKYYLHYKGWNLRYDEWIDVMRIAYKTKDPEPGSEIDNVDSSKSSPPEQINVDLKELPSTSSRTRSSVTALTPNSNVNKSPLSSVRPKRKCTLTDRPLYNIDDFDSEEEYTASEGSYKQCSKKKVMKSEPDVIKTEPSDTDNQKRPQYPRTYPSKKELMQQRNKSKEVDICKQITMQVTMPPPSIKPKTDNENEIDDGIQIELKIAPNYFLSPKVKSEKNDLELFSQSSKCKNEEIEIKSEPFIIPTKLEISSTIYYASSSKDKEQTELKQVTDVISSSSDDKFGDSKISGTYFDLIKIRSDMKGLMPPSTNSNDNIIQKTESFISNQQMEIEVSKINEPVTDKVYEFKESESCNFGTLSSVTEEKLYRSIIHNSPNLFNSKKLDERRVIDSLAQEKLVEQNRSIPFVPYRNIIYSFDNNIEIKVDDDLNIINKFQNLMISEVNVDTPNIKEIEERCFQDEINVPELQYEVLDLCMKPPRSPTANVFSIPEYYEFNAIEKGDDESELVRTENYKIETDYQKDSDLVFISKEINSSNVQIDEKMEAQSLPLLRPNLHTNIELKCKSSSQVKRDISIPKDTDDESITYCNKIIQNALIRRNHLSQNRLYMDNNDENTKSGFEFYPNSKSPSIEVKEIITKLSINNKLKKCELEVENVKDKYEQEKTMVLPELQRKEEIIDKNTLNSVLIIEDDVKFAEYDIHKPSTSKGFFDSIYQPGRSKDSFYATDTSIDSKNNFFEANPTVKNVFFDTNVRGKSSLFDPNIPSCSIKDFNYHNIPSTSKSNFYENSLPSTSKSFYNSEYNINSILICEETIPGIPTGMSEEQCKEEERKKALQAHYEEIEAALAIYSMKHSLYRPTITLMGATEKEMEEYTNILKKDGAILDKEHLLSSAKVSSKNLGINIDEPSVTEPLEKEPEKIVEKIAKPSEKLQLKRKISSPEKTSKRNKISTATAPIASVFHAEDLDEEKIFENLMAEPVYPPEMKLAQKQSDLKARMNYLKKYYSKVYGSLSKTRQIKKKIKKRKRKQARGAGES
ncbi:hypothetical protein QTP88_001942 [Uroleucon formosanum]